MVEEIGYLFDSWADTKRLMQLMNAELQALEQQGSAESIELTRELARVEEETENLRKAIKAGLDDVGWANAELRRLRAEREELLSRRERTAARPELTRVDMSLVEESKRAFGDVFANGAPKEKRPSAAAGPTANTRLRGDGRSHRVGSKGNGPEFDGLLRPGPTYPAGAESASRSGSVPGDGVSIMVAEALANSRPSSLSTLPST